MANDDARELLSRLVNDVVSVTASRLELMGDLRSSLRTAAADVASTGSKSKEVLPGTNPAGQMSQLARQLADLTNATLSHTDTVFANTQAVIESSLAATSGAGSKVAGVGKTLLSFLGGGFGLIQLFGKLLGGGQEEPLPSLAQYSLPPAVNVEAALARSPAPGLHPLRYAGDGLPRSIPASSPGPASPITIQVQAMDSRSFLDHSGEIAQAVREALLNSHALSDVVLEL